MKKYILFLTFLTMSIFGYSQLTIDTVYAGQYVIRTMGNNDYIAKFTADATITYMAGVTSVSVVDTVFYVPEGASLDTLTNFIRPSGEIAAIVFERSSEWIEAIVATQDSTIYASYGSGTNPIVGYYINAVINTTSTIKNLTIGASLTAMITEEGDYMITEEGFIMVEEY